MTEEIIENQEDAADSQMAETVTDQQKEKQEVADNDAMLAELAAEIEADKAGKPVLQMKKEEVKEEEEEAGDKGEEAEEEGEEEVEEKEEKPKPKKGSAADRIQQINKQKKALEETVAAERAERERIARENEELRTLVRERLAPKKEEAPAIEPLDPEAYAEQQKALKALEAKVDSDRFMDRVASEDAAWAAKDKNWKLKKDAVVASDALDFIARGRARNEQEAFRMAAEAMAADMYQIYKGNGSIGEYIDRRAKTVSDKWAKPQKKPSKSGVDMVELDNLRKSAGAPTNKVASNKAATGSLEDEIRREIEEERRKSSTSFDW